MSKPKHSAVPASAPVAGEATPTDDDILVLALDHGAISGGQHFGPAIRFARALLSQYAAPQASEAKLVFSQCVFHGPAPEGFADWYQWLDAPVKMGAFIRAATADDWKRPDDAPQASEAQDLEAALGAALCRANSAEAMWRKCRDELKAVRAALSAQPGAQKGDSNG